MSDDRDSGFDEWLDAAEAAEPYYLSCPKGHGSLPPRRRCPECGAGDLTERPLDATGTLETFTVTHVPTPSFEEDAPYAAGIADFGPVRVTGQVVDVDLESIEAGLPVTIGVERSSTTEDRVIVLRAV